MAKYIAVGETIEGESVGFEVRKWDFKGLKQHPITKKRMSLYVSDRNSSAEILKETMEPNDEKLKMLTAHYHRDLGDSLEADSLSIYVDCLRRITPNVKEGATHRHGAQYVTTTKNTVSIIKVPLQGFLKFLGHTSNSKIE